MPIFIAKIASLTSDSEVPAQFSRELRRADSFIKYAVLAAHKIFGGKQPEVQSFLQNCSLFLGSSFGPMEANMDVLHQVANREQTSPTLFSHSVFNAAAGYLTRIFELHGRALTITDFGFPFFQSLQQAISSLECGQSSNCLVIQVETFSQLLNDVRSSFCQVESATWQSGACAWLLTNEQTSNQALRLTNFNLNTHTALPGNYLQFEDKLEINGDLTQLQNPLDAAMEISRAMQDGSEKKYSFALVAPYGKMLLSVSP